MNVLIIGNGGREHALAWKVAKNEQVKNIFVAPGNAGSELEQKVTNVDINADNISGLVIFAIDNNIELTIVGPEAPLVAGVVDAFTSAGLACFGPSKAAAQLEGSKAFAKDFLTRHNIPTAWYKKFTEIEPALDYVRKKGAPIVIKADGLAAGKGVIVAMTLKHAESAIIDMLAGNAFGEAGHHIVIEEFLDGEEASFIAMSDGENIVALATSQDHKRAGVGDTGPNTGGMGAYSPAAVITQEMHDIIMNRIIRPTVQGMASEGNRYIGFLYAGLMIMPDGTPNVIEYNCRLGDPETQPIMMRMTSDIVLLCLAGVIGELDIMTAEFDNRAAVGVVLVSGGYPNNYKKGFEISGIPTETNDAKIFHSGTVMSDGKIMTNGGRVLCVTTLSNNVTQAQQNAYQLVKKITWNGMLYRNDIAYRAILRENK